MKYWAERKKEMNELKGSWAMQKIFGDELQEPESEKTKLKILTDKELADYVVPDQEWIIEGILLPRTLMVLGAPTFSCKSWIGIEIAHSVANSLALFGKFKTSNRKVLYIDRENGKSELKNRQRMIRGAHGLTEPSDIIWISEEEIRLDREGGAGFLEKLIVKEGIGLVIIDTLRRVVSYREDKADDVSQFIDDIIKPMCYRTGVSMIFIHHESKGKDKNGIDRLRGSSDLGNNVESVLQLSKEGDFINVMQSKIRGGMQINPFSLKIESDGISYYRMIYKGETSYKSPEERVSEEVYNWAVNRSVASFRAIEAELALNKNKNIIYRAIDLLKRKGCVRLVSRGVYETIIKGNSQFPVLPK